MELSALKAESLENSHFVLLTFLWGIKPVTKLMCSVFMQKYEAFNASINLVYKCAFPYMLPNASVGILFLR